MLKLLYLQRHTVSRLWWSTSIHTCSQCPAPPTYLTLGSARSATSLIGRISRSPESAQAEYSWPGDPGEVVWSMGNELQAGYAQGTCLAGTAYHDGQSVATEDCNGPWLRHWAPWSLLLMKQQTAENRPGLEQHPLENSKEGLAEAPESVSMRQTRQQSRWW